MNCRSCENPLAATILDLGDQPAGREVLDPDAGPADDRLRPLRIATCPRCYLVQLTAPMSSEAGLDHGHGVAASSTLLEHERRWVHELASELPRTSNQLRILDVSCSNGRFVRAIARAVGGSANIQLRGFERDPGLAGEARRGGVLTTATAFDRQAATRLAARGWLADLVVVNHALAHVDDPRGFVEGIAKLLAPEGRVVLETHHLMAIVRDGQFDAVNHAHAIYPSMLALVPLMAAHGLEIADARSIDVHGGSIRVVARRASSPNGGGGNHSITDLVEQERSFRLDDPEVLQEVAGRASRATLALREFLVSCRDEGRRALGYGAPARGTILLNMAGIDQTLLAFTVDRNPAKQNRVLAGCRIPIRHPEDLRLADPDVVLVLPWTLLPEIKAQLTKVLRADAHLVVAMPDFQMIER